MKAYITTVCAAAIMAAFADNFAPKKWQKYISLFTGAILLITLITPLLKLGKIDFGSLDIPQNTAIEYDILNEVETELTKRVEADIKQRISDEFDIKTTATVRLSVKEDKIQGVEEIKLSCAKDDRITARLCEVYGCSNIKY